MLRYMGQLHGGRGPKNSGNAHPPERKCLFFMWGVPSFYLQCPQLFLLSIKFVPQLSFLFKDDFCYLYISPYYLHFTGCLQQTVWNIIYTYIHILWQIWSETRGMSVVFVKSRRFLKRGRCSGDILRILILGQRKLLGAEIVTT